MQSCTIGFSDEMLMRLKVINENEVFRQEDIYDSDEEIAEKPKAEKFF